MLKNVYLFLWVIGSLMAGNLHAQTTLNPGDVMLTGINAGNSDIAFVTWVTLQPGTRIFFTNNGWNSTEPTTAAGNARNVEEIATWTNTTANAIPPGTVVVTKTASPYTANIGTTTVFSNAGTPNVSLMIQDGDQITVYQSASGNGYSSNNNDAATFSGKAISISAWLNDYLTSDPESGETVVSDETTYLPSDLASYSVFHSTPFLNPYIHYRGARTGLSTAGYKTEVMNSSTWQNDWFSALDATAFALGVLPVRLVKFTAQWKPAGIELNWETAREIDLQKYEVEYSSNGTVFLKAGEVVANQTSGEGHYSFKHQPDAGSKHYYRLKMVDKDGSFIYSNIQIVQKALQAGSLTIKPNPVLDQRLTVATNELPKSTYSLQISNGSGIIVYRQTVNHTGGEMSLSIQLPSLAAGIYHLQLIGNEVKLHSTIMVK
ncbi:MAG: T9SS type A sorting domain-containing protein [Williamsia sp.]|nr:T9SS type A sorting domain-containing protein [Williamsia sp.]